MTKIDRGLAAAEFNTGGPGKVGRRTPDEDFALRDIIVYDTQCGLEIRIRMKGSSDSISGLILLVQSSMNNQVLNPLKLQWVEPHV